MPLFVIYIFLICFAVVVIIISAAIFKSRRPGEKLSDTLGMPVSLFLSIVSFAASLFLGLFVTQFAAPTLTTWWWAPALRVAWQLGSGLLVAGGVLKLAKDNHNINRT